MLKVDIDKHGGGRNARIEVQGGLLEIMAEIGLVIGSIHTQFKNADPAAARAYRHSLINLLTDPDTPLWNDIPNADGVMITIPKYKEEK